MVAPYRLIAVLLLCAPNALGAEPARGAANRPIDPWVPWSDGWPPYILDPTDLNPFTSLAGSLAAEKGTIFPHLLQDFPLSVNVRDARALERPTLADVDIAVPGPWMIGAPLWLKLTFRNSYDQRLLGPGKFRQPAFAWWGAKFYVIDVATGQEKAYWDCNPRLRRGRAATYLCAPSHGTLTVYQRLVVTAPDAPLGGATDSFGTLAPVLEMVSGRQRWLLVYSNDHGDNRLLRFRGAVDFDARPATEAERRGFKPLYGYDGPRGTFEPPTDAPAELRRTLAMDWLLTLLSSMRKPPTVEDVDRLARQLEVPEFFAPLLDALRFAILRRDLGPTLAAWRTLPPPRGGELPAGLYSFTAEGFAVLSQTAQWRQATPIKERALKAEPGLAWMFEWGLEEDLDDLAALRSWARDGPQTQPATQPARPPVP